MTKNIEELFLNPIFVIQYHVLFCRGLSCFVRAVSQAGAEGLEPSANSSSQTRPSGGTPAQDTQMCSSSVEGRCERGAAAAAALRELSLYARSHLGAPCGLHRAFLPMVRFEFNYQQICPLLTKLKFIIIQN